MISPWSNPAFSAWASSYFAALERGNGEQATSRSSSSSFSPLPIIPGSGVSEGGRGAHPMVCVGPNAPGYSSGLF